MYAATAEKEDATVRRSIKSSGQKRKFTSHTFLSLSAVTGRQETNSSRLFVDVCVRVCVVDRLGFDSELCSEFETGTWDRANTVD